MQIPEAQKHKDPTDPHPKHWWTVSRRGNAGEAGQ
jgi:hypothetical protein